MVCGRNWALALDQVSDALTLPRLGATAAADTTAACKGRQARYMQTGQVRAQVPARTQGSVSANVRM
jgi:hypothetical protein